MYARMAAGAAAVVATVGDRKDDVKATGMKECCERKGDDEEVSEKCEGTEAQVRLHVEDQEARESLLRPPTTGPRRPHSLFSPVPSPLPDMSIPGRTSALQSALELDSGLPLPGDILRVIRLGHQRADYPNDTHGLPCHWYFNMRQSSDFLVTHRSASAPTPAAANLIPHVLRIHHGALVALALVPPFTFATTSLASCLDPQCGDAAIHGRGRRGRQGQRWSHGRRSDNRGRRPVGVGDTGQAG